MSGFYRQGDELYVEAVPLSRIAEVYGTPAFVYSQATIETAYKDFTEVFGDYPHQVCYSVKANSNIAILNLLAGLGAGFDIVSGGELQRVIAAGGDPRRVIFSGVGKQDWEIQTALENNIACFNVESASELTRLARIAEQTAQVAPIAIRVNPDVDAGTHPYIATGRKESKFGVAPEEALPLYRHARQSAHLKVLGINCHLGSQITEVAPYLVALSRLLSLIDELKLQDIPIMQIDLGGGFGICYQHETPLPMKEFATAILQAMAGRDEQLIFEPGRVIVAHAGMLLTRVNTLKSNGGKNFAVLDAAINDLVRPAYYQSWHGVSLVKQPIDMSKSNMPKTWDLVGPICESGDFLAKDRQLALQEGDLLAIHATGAYSFVMSSNYNTRGRAPEVLVKGNQHACVRRRETIEDQLRLESLPDKSL